MFDTMKWNTYSDFLKYILNSNNNYNNSKAIDGMFLDCLPNRKNLTLELKSNKNIQTM